MGGLDKQRTTKALLCAFAISLVLVHSSESTEVQIGELLFQSKLLGKSPGLACSSCHDPNRAFQDGYERSLARIIVLRRNAPSLLNVNRHTSFTWDGRHASLKQQILEPLLSQQEVGATEASLQRYLSTEPLLKIDFEAAAAKAKTSAAEYVAYSLERYLLEVVATKETKFEEIVRKGLTLPRAAEAGFALFTGKAGCSECHAPPLFTDNLFHDIGLPRRQIILQATGADSYSLGFDYGRGDIQPGTENLHAFRTPSLVNSAITAPYMHDGSFRSLREVIDFYDRGRRGSAPLNLTPAEKHDIIEFLCTLVDVRYQLPCSR
ncbi:hypothetical protein CQ12_29035 [Bradyrhizobium jicamae]|uniref:Cytochrome c domain-containing protein n=1 Tax=Bradyrhizobium jicamae TaxID=280332 RepID=A0A0R3MEC3_9BRAD|nr:cytochrome c peroxidase [Bradyrhizobium jicamae]KRR15997.1 hypothetical protein CQ12_29035 [Bradyrhizobium jicamae]